jgi:NAD(P)-dependent dehydrogenase (short-subunit alcohol dehydrogenase family)
MNINNKVVILTGSEGLIGNSMKSYLIKQKVKLICLDIKKKKKKANFDYYCCNILDEKKLLKIKNKIVKKYKKIDALINLACQNDAVENVKKIITFENYKTETFKNNLESNILMTYLPCKIFGNEMRNQQNGSIINFSSTYGLVAPDQEIYKKKGKRFFLKDAAYPTSKFAIIGLTKYLAAYWSGKNIRVNVIAPGGIRNNQKKIFVNNYRKKTLLNRMANKSDFNGVVHLLISSMSDYITGATFSVDGGWTTI